MAHSILIPRDREGRRGKLSPATEEAVDNKWIICSVHLSGCDIKSGHHHRACGFRLTRGSLYRDRVFWAFEWQHVPVMGAVSKRREFYHFDF